MESNFTFRVDADLKAAFERAAKSMDQSASQLLRAYMRKVVREQAQAQQRELPLPKGGGA